MVGSQRNCEVIQNKTDYDIIIKLLLQHGSVTVAVSVRVLELVACISGIASDCTICWQLP